MGFVDTTRPPVLETYARRHWDRLLRMYLAFEPKGAYQGLPPFKEEVTRNWLSSLVGETRNSNFVLLVGERVVAHAALVYYPHTPTEQEIIIFVHQDTQHRGLGRKLFLATMKWGCLQLHLSDVWLSVTRDNAKAWRLYTSIGFRPVAAEAMEPEVDMARPLDCGECHKDDCPIYKAELMQQCRESKSP